MLDPLCFFAYNINIQERGSRLSWVVALTLIREYKILYKSLCFDPNLCFAFNIEKVPARAEKIFSSRQMFLLYKEA
jgi:hypothetical protein